MASLDYSKEKAPVRGLLGPATKVMIGGKNYDFKSEKLAREFRLFYDYHGNAPDFLQLVEDIHADETLLDRLVHLAQYHQGYFKDLEGLKKVVAHHQTSSNWWSINIEDRLEMVADKIREHIPDASLKLDFDALLGATQGTYGFAKDTVLSIPELLRLVKSLATDSKTRHLAAESGKEIFWVLIQLRYGRWEAKKEAAKKVAEFADKIWKQLSEEISADWDQAVLEGREVQLISRWSTRALWEIFTAALAVTKGPSVAQKANSLRKGLMEAEKVKTVALTTVEKVKGAAKAVETAETVEVIKHTRVLKRYGGQGPTVILKGPAIKQAVKVKPGKRWEVEAIKGAVKELEKKPNSIPIAEILEKEKLRKAREFDSALGRYAKSRGLSDFEKAHIAKFKEGASFFLIEPSFKRHVVRSGMVGFPDNSQFVALRSQAENLVREAGTRAEAYEQALGFDRGHLKGARLLRIDFNLKLDYHPRLPSGREMGANSHFIPLGKTSGGMDELVYDRLPVSEILRVEEVGVLK